MDSSRTLVRGDVRVCDERPARRNELVLGRYRLLERLGSGGFGTVWCARDEQLERAVALKRIALPSAQERDRALREAQATARLSHPAIVALYEACADEEAFYLVSELVEGKTLADLIAADELADEEILEIGLALTGALEHAHARGVIHRDVKPHNVLVPAERATSNTNGSFATAKLADFGGALLAGAESLTRTGDVYGTLAYMAPEQCDGAQVGPAADLYSLALVLYEALTGVNPVRGRTPAATARRIGAPIEPLERRRRDLPRELTRSLDAALAVERDRRGTLADLSGALEGALRRGLDRKGPFSRSSSAVTAAEVALDRSPRLEARGTVHDTASYERPFFGRDAQGTLDGSHDPHRFARAHSRSDGTSPSLAEGDEAQSPPTATRRLSTAALPRSVWLGLVLAAALWQGAVGRPGVALLMLAAAAPLLALPRRSGPGWLAAAAAPALGALGLAGAFPAFAGQRASAPARAGLAALGFWWLALAEPLLGKRLWLGPPAGVGTRSAWEASLGTTATHVIGPLLTPELALGAVAWALGAAALPLLVRGRNAALDVLAAIAWTVFLLGAAPLAERAWLADPASQAPLGAVLGSVLGCAVAICARALRGPA
ncbi:MAG TPA: serine/threonine-protein kinase [Solirubrobacteraceae bacterium]|nr:serine/threonine-protein kinase [Solirubrobacteraceae bacterium]